MPSLDSRPRLVLVIDDDPSVRRALDRLLRSAGMTVEVFASTAELLARELPAQSVCLVMDLHLPGVSGLDLLRRLHAARQSLPVLIMTGDPDPDLREQALQAGAVAFLTKPLDEDLLLQEVQRALALPR